MLSLFPELEDGLNIAFQNASSKSKRRFKNAHKSPSTMLVSRDLWDEISLDRLVKRHNKEVTHLYMTKVPSFMVKLDNIDRRKCDSWRSLRLVLREGDTAAWKSLSEREHELIQNYLYPKMTQIQYEKGNNHLADSETMAVNAFQKEAPRINSINGCQIPDITLEAALGGDPVENAHFPDIGFGEAKDDDPVKNAHFPDIGLDEAPEDDPVKSAEFPDIGLDEPSSVENGGVPHVEFPLVDGLNTEDSPPEPTNFPDLM